MISRRSWRRSGSGWRICLSTKGAKWDAAPTGTSTRRGEKMGKSRGGGSRLARVLALPATARDGWVGAGSGRARGARRRWSRGRVPGQTLRDVGSARPPRGPVAPLELPRRSPVGGRRSGPAGRPPRAWSWRRDSSWDLGGRWSLWVSGLQGRRGGLGELRRGVATPALGW